MKRLEGKVAVVTGGNSGIGLATAKRFQEEGAKSSHLRPQPENARRSRENAREGLLAVQADVSKLADIDKLYAEVSRTLGKIDVLFVNAGVAKFAPLADTSESLFDEQFDINVKGAYFTIQKALPFLNDGASIILNTSVAGIKGTVAAQRLFGDKSGDAFHGQNRGGRTRRTRHSRERRGSGADRHADLRKNRDYRRKASTNSQRMSSRRVPMRRFGQPEEVAGAVAFLGVAGCVLYHRRRTQRRRRVRANLSLRSRCARVADALVQQLRRILSITEKL